MNPNDPYAYGQGNSPPPPLRHAHVTNTGDSSWPYFIRSEGIEHRVLQAEICLYLGNNARVKRGTYEGVNGYYYCAYRALTNDMIDTLKDISTKWWQEKRHNTSDDYHISSTFRERELPNFAQPPPYHDPLRSANQTHPPLANSQYQDTHDGNRFRDDYHSQYVQSSGPWPGGAPRQEVYYPSTSGMDQNPVAQVTPAMPVEFPGDSTPEARWQHQSALHPGFPPENRRDRPIPRPYQPQDPTMENRHDRSVPRPFQPQDPTMESRHDGSVPHPQDPTMENRRNRPAPRPHQEYYSKQGGR